MQTPLVYLTLQKQDTMEDETTLQNVMLRCSNRDEMQTLQTELQDLCNSLDVHYFMQQRQGANNEAANIEMTFFIDNEPFVMLNPDDNNAANSLLEALNGYQNRPSLRL